VADPLPDPANDPSAAPADAPADALAALGALPAMLWRAHDDGRLDYVNPAWTEYTGLAADALIAAGFASLVHPEDRARHDAMLAHRRPEDRDCSIELRLRAGDGGYRWFHCRARRPAAATAPGAPAWIGIATDIDELKRGQQTVADSESRYRALFANMSEGFAVGEAAFDERGQPADIRFIEMNAAFERQSGLDRAAIVGRWLRPLLPKLERHWIEAYGRVARDGRAERFEHYNRDTDRHYSVYAFSPAPRRFAILFTDISEHKRSEQRLRASEERARRHAEEALLDRNKFAAVIDSMLEPVLIADPQGRLQYMNAAGRDYHGVSSTDEIGHGLGALATRYALAELDGSELPQDRWPITRVARGERIAHEVRVHDRLRGRSWSAIYAGAPVRNAAGEIVQLVLTLHDTTERRQREETLIRIDAERRLAVEVLERGDAMYVFDAEYRLVMANPAWEAMVGQPRDRLLGRVLWESFPELEGSGFQRVFRRVVETRAPATHEEYYAPLGLWTEVSVYPASNGGAAVFVRETTARRRTEQALRDSETRLRDLANNISQFAWMATPRGEVTWFNQRWYDYTGATPEHSLGTHWQAYHHPAHRDRALTKFVHCLASGEAWEDTFPLRGRDGSYRWFLSRALPIRDESGHVLRWFGTNTDVTEQRAAEQALRRSEARARAVLQSLAEGVVLFDAEGRVETVNAAVEELLGSSLESLQLDSHEDPRWRLLRGDGSGFPRDEQPATRALRGGTVLRDVEMGVPRADGSVRWISVNAQPVRDADGTLFGAVASFFDITGRKNTEAALREADRRKDEFLAMLSHELRNPLAPIRNAVFILKHVPPDSAQANAARAVIERQVEHISALVDDLLDVTRIARGKIELARSRLDLRMVVHAAVEDLRSVFDQRRVSLSCRTDDEPIFIDGDPVRLAQVFGNLLSNAAKFTPEGGRVELQVQALDAQRAEVTVEDDGVGIDPALAERIFEPFVQADDSLARSRGGLGLGLALVRGIVELHGGEVSAHSEGTGCGARFRVLLPRAEARTGTQPAQPAPLSRGSHRRVLVVDDNVDAAETLAQLLALGGDTVDIAHDGPSALAMASEQPPDVVLCDIGLPGMDGYEVARALRARYADRLTLVAVSGYAQPEDRRRAREAGFDHHVAKPPDPGEIQRLMKAA
jgi:PAS domain S-box-containing protein